MSCNRSLSALAPRLLPWSAPTGARSVNAVRLAANVAGGLVAIYWLGLGLAGFFAAIAVGFCLYAVLLAFAVTWVKVPNTASGPR
jgi:hypothetical protein